MGGVTKAVSDATFEQEVLQLEPEIPRGELCDMVDDYIYYQTDGVSREEAHAIVDITCRLPLTEAAWRFTLTKT